MSHPTVLIAEDDAELRRLLVTGLREAGFDAEGVGTGTAFLSLLETRTAHALILDIGLPDADGRDVCQAIRARGIETPVLFLSARDAVPDRISGFTSGGDDYVTKPFSFAEVVVRLHALLRRTNGSSSSVTANGLELDPTRHAVRFGESSQTLTPTELRILGGARRARRRDRAPARPRRSGLAARRARQREHPRRLRRAPAAQAARAAGGAHDPDDPRRRLHPRVSLHLVPRSVRGRLLVVVALVVGGALAAMTVGFNILLAHSLDGDATRLAHARATHDALDAARGEPADHRVAGSR